MLGADLRAALFPGHASPLGRAWGQDVGSHGAYGWVTGRGGAGASVDGDPLSASARLGALGTLLGAFAALADAANVGEAREALEASGSAPLSFSTSDVSPSPSLHKSLLSFEAVDSVAAVPASSIVPAAQSRLVTGAAEPPCPTVPLMLDGRTLVAWRTAQALRALLARACEDGLLGEVVPTATQQGHSLSLSRSLSPAPSPARALPVGSSGPRASPHRTLPPINQHGLQLRVVEAEGGTLCVSSVGARSSPQACNIPIPLLSNIVWSVVDAQCVGWSASLASAEYRPGAAEDAITLCLAPLLGLLPALAAMTVRGDADAYRGTPALQDLGLHQVCWRLGDACITSLTQLVEEALEDVEDDVVTIVGHAVEVAHVVFLAAATTAQAIAAVCPASAHLRVPGAGTCAQCGIGNGGQKLRATLVVLCLCCSVRVGLCLLTRRCSADVCGLESVVLTLCGCLQSVCEAVSRHGHRCVQGTASTEVADVFLQTASGMLVAALQVLGALSCLVDTVPNTLARDVPSLLDAVAAVDSYVLGAGLHSLCPSFVPCFPTR